MNKNIRRFLSALLLAIFLLSTGLLVRYHLHRQQNRESQALELAFRGDPSSESTAPQFSQELSHRDTPLWIPAPFQEDPAPTITLPGEGAVMAQPPAPPWVPEATPYGEALESCPDAEIDYSHTRDGYVMARYLTPTDLRLKVLIKSPTITYSYDLPPGEWTVFPLSDGSGSYQVGIYRNVSGSRYALVISADFHAELQDEFAPFLRPNQYVNYTADSQVVQKAAALTGDMRLLPPDTESIIRDIYHTANRSITHYLQTGDDDFSFSIPGLARFRVNTYRQRGSMAAVIRVVSFDIPDWQEVHIPKAVMDLADIQSGMSLSNAYRKQEAAKKDAEIAELKRQLEAEKQNKRNRSNSPGSQRDSGGRRMTSDHDKFEQALFG